MGSNPAGYISFYFDFSLLLLVPHILLHDHNVPETVVAEWFKASACRVEGCWFEFR